MSKVIAVAHPGQSREVWVGLGQLVWRMLEGDRFPSQYCHAWDDGDVPVPTHTPEEFLRAFPPRPGGSLEAEARLRGLL